jgi:hypothetical protein
MIAGNTLARTAAIALAGGAMVIDFVGAALAEESSTANQKGQAANTLIMYRTLGVIGAFAYLVAIGFENFLLDMVVTAGTWCIQEDRGDRFRHRPIILNISMHRQPQQ